MWWYGSSKNMYFETKNNIFCLIKKFSCYFCEIFSANCRQLVVSPAPAAVTPVWSESWWPETGWSEEVGTLDTGRHSIMEHAGIKTCCLYMCLIFLSGVILATSFTIQWILYSIQFSLVNKPLVSIGDNIWLKLFQEGVGVVSLVEGGLKISGQTHALDTLLASR